MNSARYQSELNQIAYELLPPPQPGVCQILHDRESSRIRGGALAALAGKIGLRYAWLSRFYDASAKKRRGLPETVRFNGGKSHVKLAPQWMEFICEKNTARAVKYIMRPDSGWRNKGDESTFEQLGFGGAFVVVTKIEHGRAYIESYYNDKHPDDYNQDYLQLFSVVDQTNEIGVPNASPVYSFVIANPGEALWMDARDLTFVRPVALPVGIDVVMDRAA